MAQVYVVFQNENLVGVFSSKQAAAKAFREVDYSLAFENDMFFEGELKVFIKEVVIDRVYHPSTYKSISVPATNIKRKYTKKTTAAIAGDGIKRGRGRPRKVVEVAPEQTPVEPVAPVETLSIEPVVEQEKITPVKGKGKGKKK